MNKTIGIDAGCDTTPPKEVKEVFLAFGELRYQISILEDVAGSLVSEISQHVLAMQERITALESHLTMLQNGTSIPFPAVTDRHLIDSIKEKSERLTAQEAEIAVLRKVAEAASDYVWPTHPDDNGVAYERMFDAINEARTAGYLPDKE